jgi:hypothetical protein
MMNLKVFRYNFKPEFTQGLFLIDGLFQCYTLEDEIREKKVWGETAVPYGRYKIELRTEGKFHENYSKKFPEWHKGMLHVTNVPGFEYILIHIGNFDKDTAGCLLVGNDVEASSLEESTAAYKMIYLQIIEPLLKGEDVYIEYLPLAV